MTSTKKVAATTTALLLLAAASARAQSIPPVMTAKSLPPATVALIDPESGTSAGGGSSDIKIAVGDVILFRFKYFTSPNNALRGIAGYLTEFVPKNTRVVGVRLVDKNGVTVLPRYPGLTFDGTGSNKNTGFSVTCSGGPCTIQAGSLAQAYADTGIFWSNDATLARSPDPTFITLYDGTVLNPDPANANSVRGLLGIPNPNSASSYSHDSWDWVQSAAFSASSSPGYGPWPPANFSSPVAGPSTHYSGGVVNGSPLVFDGNGPWNRVIYPGSTIGVGTTPVAHPGELERALRLVNNADYVAGTMYVTPANARTATAVRYAVGELRAGEPGYAEVALQVTALPFDGSSGTNQDCGEIFGGGVAWTSGGSGQNGTQNAWPAFTPAPACVYLNLLFEVDVDQYLIAQGTNVTYSLRAKNLSLNNDTNVCVRYRWSAGTVNATPPGGSTTPPAGCPTCPSGFSCMYWSAGTMTPSQEWPSTGNVMNMSFKPSGGGQMAAVMFADYFSTRIPAGYTTQVMTIISPISFVSPTLSSPTWVTAGNTVTLTGNITNTGPSTGSFNQLALWFPGGQSSGWAITSGGPTLSGCAQLTPPAGYDYNRWQCNFVQNSFAAGASQALNITIRAPASAATALYPIDLQIWAFDNGNGGNYDTVFPAMVVQAVGEPRTAAPIVGTPQPPPDNTCTLVSSTNGIGGTSEANATIKLYFNGVQYATGTADASGNWFIPSSAWAATFGQLYGGAEVRATATAPGKLESPFSTTACFPKPTKACSDGIDNDGDGFTDFPADPGCTSPIDDSELPDNRIYPATDECNDGIDNDGDGLTDMDDPDCQCPGGLGHRKVERPGVVVPQCNDGCDNDGDGLIDFPADPGCHSANDNSEVDVTPPSGTIPARLLILFDTSGSMNWNTCGDNTFMNGDGSNECMGSDLACGTCSPSGCGDGIADDTRVWKVKNGVAAAVTAFGEVEWGLMRFHQRGQSFAVTGGVGCPTSNASLNSGGWQGSYLPPCGGGFNAADLLVKFSSDNTYDLLQWMDNRSNWTDWSASNTYPIPMGFDFELRGTGTTPIAGSLASALTYLETVKGADPQGGCRPYRVILVTDGAESCACDPGAATCQPPVDAAAALLANGFPTYVIGFATPDTTIQSKLQAIAAAGRSGGTAIFADDSVNLSTAIAGIVKDSIKVELCNGLDDNCNGITDEGFPVGVACDNGLLGICKCSGTYGCKADGSDVQCNYIHNPLDLTTCQPQGVEICCNGLDDNCDGRIDEPPCHCGKEVCNGIDDDGNGLTDDGPMPGVGDPCGTDVGECNPGITKCVSGRIVCDYTGVTHPFPVDETCNCLDDNCNGITDEGVTRECYTCANGGSPGVGECRGGVQVCDPSSCPTINWTNPSCGGQVCPTAEVCDGKDNNCNGLTDEDALGNPLTERCYSGTTGCDWQTGLCKGECRFGTRTCSGGAWGPCVGEVLPSAEVCDGKDNDCDGTTDGTGGVILTQSCYSGPSGTRGVGICHAGTQTCNPATGQFGACVGEVTPGTETCNGQDDDCNGQIDDGLTRSCYTGPSGTQGVGICHAGTETCSNGAWGSCSGQQTPTTEVCDGLDNDCNGQTDENTAQPCYDNPQIGCDISTHTCKGVCQFGVRQCVNGVLSATCTGQVRPTTETCNGRDDDCDGTVDGTAGVALTQPCYTGPSGTQNVGICHGGTQTCTNATWGSCTGQQLPTTEVCDGQDNNCNGQTDENTSELCYDLPYDGCDPNTRICKGVCALGTRACVNGVLSATCANQIRPTTEVCNGLDDDCDGTTDGTAGTPLARSCYDGPSGTEGVGPCHAGTQQCAAGSWGTCSGEVVPVPETCNNVDDNCNGLTDEGLQNVRCYQPPPATPWGCDLVTGICVGTCGFGHQSCTNGSMTACTGATYPVAEVCNGLDDNCNGAIDEGLTESYYTGPTGTENVGECKAGVRTCNVGTWDITTPQVVPKPEECNGKDDDCDGLTDEDALGNPLQESCYDYTKGGCDQQTGVCLGVCAHGLSTCSNGALGPCVGMITPTPEVCDNLDNNCNGEVDEGLTQPYYTGRVPEECDLTTEICKGECKVGHETCTAGVWYADGNQVLPSPEICDNKDNDCNGFTDDGLVGVKCYDGGSECDLQTGICKGICQIGTKACTAGVWSGCDGQVLPRPEVCNCFDDDCNGETDEGTLPGVGDQCDVGVCTGVKVCDPHLCAVVCSPTGGQGVEICDGRDNNCNNLIDEPPGPNDPPLCEKDPTVTPPGPENHCAGDQTTCTPDDTNGFGYVCSPGHYACVNGAITCVGAVLPQPEVCDGIDNDCNGITDDGDLCSEGAVCYKGECVDPCKNDEFPCTGGRTCVDGANIDNRLPCQNPGTDICYCISAVCGNVQCDPGWICKEQDGQCHDLCENVTCAPPTQCYYGQCLDCTVLGCPTGQFCAGQTCVDDPCANVQCAEGEICTQGQCVSNCAGINCGTGQVCRAGECVADPCSDVLCVPGKVCDPNTGECVGDPCIAQTCAPGALCSTQTGQCMPDPCLQTTCGYCTECVADRYYMTATCQYQEGCGQVKIYAAGGCSVAGDDGGGGWKLIPLLLLVGLLIERRRRAAGGGR